MAGFIRMQEERMALRLLAWQYDKQNLPQPPAAEMERHAKRIVDEAHRIAKQRGHNVWTIMKELIADFKKK